DLARVDRPLADRAEGRRPRRLASVAVRVAEVRERAVDGVETVRAGGDDHARAGVVPEVAGILGRQRPADALARREIAEAEDERLQARRAGGDLLDPRQRRRLLDERLEADPPPEPELRLELLEERLEEPDVARRLHLREDEDVETLAGPGDDLQHVVVGPA